jgi:hypothetical protein
MLSAILVHVVASPAPSRSASQVKDTAATACVPMEIRAYHAIVASHMFLCLKPKAIIMRYCI